MSTKRSKIKGKRKATNPSYEDMMRVRARHRCETKFIVEVNGLLSDDQKGRIRNTPFRWALDIEDGMKISGLLLLELLNRWVEVSGGFRVRGRVVGFTPVDVCFALGLRVIGEKVPLDGEQDVGEGQVRCMFKGEKITTELIVERLRELVVEDDVDECCRLYILLVCNEFYFPKTTQVLQCGVDKVLDDLESLDRYAWGVAVYEFLVDGLNRAARCLHQRKNLAQIHITGCVAVLQIWAFEHLGLRPTKGGYRKRMFPRFLQWHTISGSRADLEDAFENNLVVHEILSTTEDEEHSVVVEALREAKGGYPHWGRTSFDKEDMQRQINLLVKKNELMEHRMALLEEELKSMKELLMVGSNGKRKHIHVTKQEKREENPIDVGHEDDFPIDVKAVVEPSSEQKCGKRKGSQVSKDEKEEMKKYKKLFDYCVDRKLCNQRPNEILISMFDQYLNRCDVSCMKPRAWVNNMVFYLAARWLMEDQKNKWGCVKRYILDHSFVGKVTDEELEQFRRNRADCWSKRTIRGLVHGSAQIEVMKASELIFAPAIFEHHWFCYVVDREKRIMYVLDSMLKRKQTVDRTLLDNAMMVRFGELLGYLNEEEAKTDVKMKMKKVDLPQQYNNDDCGIYVLKYLEIWDGVMKWGDKTMPDYSLDDINRIWRELLISWVLHPLNVLHPLSCDFGHHV